MTGPIVPVPADSTAQCRPVPSAATATARCDVVLVAGVAGAPCAPRRRAGGSRRRATPRRRASRSSSRPKSVTVAPSRSRCRAEPRPMPLPPPVMSAPCRPGGGSLARVRRFRASAGDGFARVPPCAADRPPADEGDDRAPMPPAGDGVGPRGQVGRHAGPRPLRRAATTTLTTGNGLDATTAVPRARRASPSACGCDAVLDGEVIAIDADGRPDFGLLQHRMHLAAPAEVDGGRRPSPGEHRPVRRALARRARRLPAAVAPTGAALLEDARRADADLAGAGGPRRRRRAARRSPTRAAPRGHRGEAADSLYLPGKRTTAWRKVKVRRRQEIVVGGWWPGEGNRSGGLGSLLVGVHDPSAPGNPLRFAGKVGTGFTAAVLADYERLLADLAIDECPFDPRAAAGRSPAAPVGCGPRSSSRSSSPSGRPTASSATPATSAGASTRTRPTSSARPERLVVPGRSREPAPSAAPRCRAGRRPARRRRCPTRWITSWAMRSPRWTS